MKYQKLFICLSALVSLAAFTGNALAKNPLQVLSLNQGEPRMPYALYVDTPFKLQNDFATALYRTTIVREPGQRLAVIDSIKPGQHLDLEFPRQGRYSICFDLSRNASPDDRRCIPLDVRPRLKASRSLTHDFDSRFILFFPTPNDTLKGATS